MYIVIIEYKSKNTLEDKFKNKEIIVIDDFMNDKEIEKVISYSYLLQKSKIKDRCKSIINEDIRDSYTGFLPINECGFIIKKVQSLIGSTYRTYDIQLLKYYSGGYYKKHYDYFDNMKPSNFSNRKYTLLVYLNDEFTGGTTKFIRLNKEIKPKKGRVVIWENISNNKFNEYTEHQGMPIIGEKYALNIWVNNKKF